MEQFPGNIAAERRSNKPEESVEQREQRFRFGPWVFDVAGALVIVAESPREPRPMPVEPWARFYGITEPVEGSIPLFGPRDLDVDYALTTDLNEPVLIATMRNKAGGEFPLLIDGAHRLYRAYGEGVEKLPAYVLTADETVTIRQDGFIDRPGRR